LRPVQARIDATAIASLSKEFNRAPSIALFQLIVGAARGLALGEVIAPGDATGGEAILLLRELIEATGWPLGRKSDLSRAE
jgi:hypothetical protein